MKFPDSVEQLFNYVITAVAGILSWLWLRTMNRITDLEKHKVDQKTFDTYVIRAEKDRNERRETELALFTKVDGLRDHVDRKFDDLTKLITGK